MIPTNHPHPPSPSTIIPSHGPAPCPSSTVHHRAAAARGTGLGPIRRHGEVRKGRHGALRMDALEVLELGTNMGMVVGDGGCLGMGMDESNG